MHLLVSEQYISAVQFNGKCVSLMPLRFIDKNIFKLLSCVSSNLSFLFVSRESGNHQSR